MDKNDQVDQSQYNVMFYESLYRGYVDCAKLIYPYVTNFSLIKLQPIIHNLFTGLEFGNDKNVDNILQKCYNVVEFLIDNNFVHDPNEDHPENFFLIPYITYERIKKYPTCYKIAELIYQLINQDTTKIIDDIKKNGLTGGLYLLEDMNLIKATDFANTSGFYVDNFMKLAELLLKYQNLTDKNLQEFMEINFSNLCGFGLGKGDGNKLSNLIDFLKRNHFYFGITDTIAERSWDTDVCKILLNSGLEWKLNGPIHTFNQDTYDLLKKNNINVIYITVAEENEYE